MTSAHMEKEVEYGVFMPVGEGGWIRSTTAPPVPATYAYNRQVAILAEHIGLDFLLAMAKWRGFGGASNHWDTTLESMTVITALAEVTSRVRLIPTVHTLAFWVTTSPLALSGCSLVWNVPTSTCTPPPSVISGMAKYSAGN